MLIQAKALPLSITITGAVPPLVNETNISLANINDFALEIYLFVRDTRDKDVRVGNASAPALKDARNA